MITPRTLLEMGVFALMSQLRKEVSRFAAFCLMSGAQSLSQGWHYMNNALCTHLHSQPCTQAQ